MIFHNILQKNPNELFGQPIVYKIHYIQIYTEIEKDQNREIHRE